MTQISASLVKELREKTNVGMMDCKKALTETNGNIEEAVDWLRKKGISSAAKKADRIAAEGLCGVFVENNKGVALEINSETDFCAKNPNFQSFVAQVAKVSLHAKDMDALLSTPYGNGKNISEELVSLIASIGENITIRRFSHLELKNKGAIISYIHNAATNSLGKIAVLVALESEASTDALIEFGKKLAMHIAAVNPEFLTIADVSSEALEREKNILTEQAKASGRPENVIEKMVEGRIRKFYEESVFCEQAFVMDGKTKISELISKTASELKHPISIKGFVRFAVGEGIDKKETDFAKEVQAQL